uniref:SMP-30/Gluconolactonase/LRE-like region domain-containing protein n=1 Tax=Haptolina brevifila TaxID=156173 RepID=A0A7S2HHR4_9EUKA|mmetsp:Transcript_54672/g.108530  ORF Transcript_54672/g.108530 Transcript_54672/m.108530 type:complete len:260 (+) Transcript_54672:168-947(+)
MLMLITCLATTSQVTVDPLTGIVTPSFSAEQRFHEEAATPRYRISEMEYVDGASSTVLRHPYTILHAGSNELYVASFTLNHVIRLRWLTGKRAQYKVFVSGKELDGPVGMALQHDALYVASFTNDVVLRVNASSGELLGRIGNEDTLDCPEGIAIGPDGLLYVTSFLLPYLSIFEPHSGKYLGKFGSSSGAIVLPSAPHSKVPGPVLRGAEDVTFDLAGDVHVTAYYSNAVQLLKCCISPAWSLLLSSLTASSPTGQHR